MLGRFKARDIKTPSIIETSLHDVLKNLTTTHLKGKMLLEREDTRKRIARK